MVALVLSSGQLLAATKTAEAAKPNNAEAKAKPRIEVCFVLDTTGSMSGLIEGAKQKIWSIANEMVSAKPTPDLRFGLVAYRDRGDHYITKLFDLTNDIDAVYANLQGFRADGGGDLPESVNQAMHEAVTKMSWSKDRQVLKIIFLVGDSPPHMDYADDVKYPDVCQLAAKRDLLINTVQCGNTAQTTPVWQEIAKLAEGSYAAIAQSGGMVAMTTPMDGELAALNRKLGGTLVAYGSEPARRSVAAKQLAAEAAPASVTADRLHFNVTAGVAVQGEGELLDSLANGKLKLAEVKKDQLPVEMQKLSEAELKSAIEKKQKERAELQTQVAKLAKQREEFLTKERQRLAAAGKGDSFDEKVAQTLRAQAAKKGIDYGK